MSITAVLLGISNRFRENREQISTRVRRKGRRSPERSQNGVGSGELSLRMRIFSLKPYKLDSIRSLRGRVAVKTKFHDQHGCNGIRAITKVPDTASNVKFHEFHELRLFCGGYSIAGGNSRE